MKRLIAGMVVCILAALLPSACAAEPTLRIAEETWQNDTVTYTVTSSEPLSGMLICAVYDVNGALQGVAVEKSEDAQAEWTVDVTTDLERGKSKMFFWNATSGTPSWINGNTSDWDHNQQTASYEHITVQSTIGELLHHPAFAGFAKHILPWDGRSYDENMPLSQMARLMPYHSHVNPQNSVDALNRLIDDVNSGKQVFYDFYTEEEKAQDPSKEDTGLFFYRGEAGAPFAVQCAGGGFSHVGSLHESMPHCMAVNAHGYNAFAIKYRVGSEQEAAEDLAAAISFILENADVLEVSREDYSVWGGSAGARMAADIGSYGTAYWGAATDSRPAAVIMLYTGRSDYTPDDPPTFVGVGEDDGIANPNTMKRRADALAALGIDTEFHLYPNLGHGFGLGLGTSAEGWVDDAVAFCEKHIK